MEITASQRLVSALRAADPDTPEALVTFDRIAGGEGFAPDFLEWSAHVGERLDASRLTYYFDAKKHGAAELAAVGERFGALARALDAKLPPLLSTYAELVPNSASVLQVVLGIDERPGTRRVKLYLVFDDAAPDLVDGLLRAASVSRPPSLDAARVYILGIDCGPEGLVDVKLYYRLEVPRLPRVVANLGDVRDLYAATRDVVLQRCLVTDRTQLYLHASNDVAITKYLERRTDHATARLLARRHAIETHLHPVRIAPWIISFGFRDHRLQLGASNVYFHVDTHGSAEYDRDGL